MLQATKWSNKYECIGRSLVNSLRLFSAGILNWKRITVVMRFFFTFDWNETWAFLFSPLSGFTWGWSRLVGSITVIFLSLHGCVNHWYVWQQIEDGSKSYLDKNNHCDKPVIFLFLVQMIKEICPTCSYNLLLISVGPVAIVWWLHCCCTCLSNLQWVICNIMYVV